MSRVGARCGIHIRSLMSSEADVRFRKSTCANSSETRSRYRPMSSSRCTRRLNHEAASEVLRDPHRFTSRGYAMSMGQVFGHSILEMDPPEHTRYRALIQHAFTKRALDRWERELVGPVVHGLIDRFIERGSADLVRELTFPFPVAVIAGMIGVPKDQHHNFHRWAVELISVHVCSRARRRGLRETTQSVRGDSGRPPKAAA